MTRRVRRVLKLVGLGAIALVVLCAAAWVFREALFGGLVRRAITGALSDALGGRYEIRTIGGSWIRGLDVEGLTTVEAPPTGALAGLEVERATAHYDLLELLTGGGLDGVSSLTVRGASVDLDLDRDAGTTAGDLPSFTATPVEMSLPRLDLRGRVSVRTDTARLEAEDVRVLSAESETLDVAVREVTSGRERTPLEGSLEGRLTREGSDRIRWVSQTSLGGLGIPSLAWRLESGRVVARIQTKGGPVEITADPAQIEATTQGLELAGLPAWVRPFVPKRPGLPLGGRLSGRVTLRHLDPLRASFDLRGEDLAWPDRTLDRLRATGRSRRDDDALLLDALELEGADAIAQLRGAVLDPALPFLLRDVRSLVVEVDDLRTLWPEADRALRISVRAHGAAAPSIVLDELRVEDPEIGSALLTGTLDLPASADAWRETRVTLDLQAEIARLVALHPELGGRAGAQGKLAGTLDDLRTDVEIQGRSASVAGLAVNEVGAAAQVRWPDVEVERLRIAGSASEVEARGRLLAKPWRVPAATFLLEADDLAPALRAVAGEDAPRAGGTLRAEGDFRWEGEDVELQARVVMDDVRIDETAIGRVEGLVRLADDSLHADRLEAVGPWGRAKLGDASYRLDGASVRVKSLDAVADGHDVRLLAAAEVQIGADEITLLPTRLLLDARQEALLFVTVRPNEKNGVLDLQLRASDAGGTSLVVATPFAWDEERVHLRDLRVREPEAWSTRGVVRLDLEREAAVVESAELQVEGETGRLNGPLHLFHRDGVLTVQGLDASMKELRAQGGGRVWIEEKRAEVSALLARCRDDVEARLTAPMAIRWSDDRVRIDDLDAIVEGAHVRGSVSVGDEMEADLIASGIELVRWLPDVTGSASARLRLVGEEARLDLAVPDLGALEQIGTFRATVRQGREGGGLVVDDLRVEGPHGLLAEGRGVLPWRVDPEEGLRRLADAPAELRVDGRLGAPPSVGEIQAGPLVFSIRGRGDELRVKAGLADVVMEAARDQQNDVEVSASLSARGLQAEARVVDERTLTLRGALRVEAGADWTRPDTWDALLDAPLEASLASEVRDWKPIARLLQVKRLEGSTRVELKASGALRRPVLEGAAEVDGLAIALDKSFPPFEGVTGRIVWNGRRATIERLEGLLGYEPFRISGEVETPRGAYPVFDVRAAGENLLLVRTEDMRLRSSLDLAVTGPLDGLLAKGEVRITDLFYAVTLSPGGEGPGIGEGGFVLFTLPEWPLSEARFDVKVVADESIRIRNNLFVANVSADIALGGKGARPRPEGRIVTKNARVILPTRTLFVEGAEIRFPPGAPFTPTVRATARGRAGGYELGARVSGRLPDLDLSVFTRPQLPPEEAMLLLATGTAGSAGSGGIEALTFQAAIAFFGDNLLTFAKSESDPELRPFFDRFTMVVGRERSRRGRETVEAEVETIDRLFLRAERDRYDESNLGFVWRMRFR